MLEPLERVERPLGRMLLNNFLGGIVWGLGATIGVSLILTVVGFLIRGINFVPLVGSFVASVMHYVLQSNSVLR